MNDKEETGTEKGMQIEGGVRERERGGSEGRIRREGWMGMPLAWQLPPPLPSSSPERG
jgi:hypothetical protein